MRSFIIFACLLLYVTAFAGKPMKVEADYIYYAPETMSIDEAKRNAVERAKIQALENAFGTRISQTTSTMITSENDVSATRFSVLGLSDVKGIWLETIGTPELHVAFEEHTIVVTCRITGLAKEIAGIAVDYEAYTLRNFPDKRSSSTQFHDGDDMFLYFRTPVSGFLNVFLLCDSENQAFCLLPYKRSKSAFFVEADRDYILFSKEQGGKVSAEVDEYTLTAGNDIEYNQIVIVFSPEEFSKTGLNDTANTVPKMTSISKFNEWLSMLRTKNDHITTTVIPVTIKQK